MAEVTRTSYAPIRSLVDQAPVGKLEDFLPVALVKDANVLAGRAITGTVAQATVLDHVCAEMKLYAQESSGFELVEVKASTSF